MTSNQLTIDHDTGEVVGFDYTKLPEDTAKMAQDTAQRIRTMHQNFVENTIKIGQALIDMKEHLPHGQFGLWCKHEFGWTDRYARDFLHVARRFGPNPEKVFRFPQSAVLALAAPSVPNDVVEDVIERAEKGERMTVEKVRAAIAESKATADRPKRRKGREAQRSTKPAENVTNGSTGYDWDALVLRQAELVARNLMAEAQKSGDEFAAAKLRGAIEQSEGGQGLISVDKVTECIETLVRIAVFGTAQPIAFDGPKRKMALTPDGKPHLAEPERPARSRTADSEPPAATAEPAEQPAEAASEQPRLQVIEGGAGEPAEKAHDMPEANGRKPPAAEAAKSKPKRKRSHIRY